jgi:2,5-diamino-6-(ribosylamino)-4(3H)-pyrimidinone 5'-phosphate reductase
VGGRRGVKPFVFVNVAMTADGKIAPASRRFKPFGGSRDQQHLLELRATADAVMAGARTVDLDRVNMGPGPARYRRLRLRRGLAEYNLRIIVSGAGTIDPRAEIFQHRFSPIIILTTERAGKSQLTHLRALTDEVKICGAREVDFSAALPWLRKKWNIRRLLCEGGGEVNGAVFQAGLVDEIHVTLCPILLGGRTAPTPADGPGVADLADAARFRLVSMKRSDPNLFLVYERNRARLKIP